MTAVATSIPGLLLLQALAVLAMCRVCAVLARRLGQPEVIGEIAGGLLLGPSALGLLWPQSQTLLFPAGGLGGLRALSEIGIVLFLFTVGLETDVETLRKRARTALLVSWASIATPFALGVMCAALLHARYAPDGDFWIFASFMGVAMSVTAFPVLARILREAGLEKTPLGATALACATADDAAAWCALAAVAGMARGGGAGRGAAVVGELAVYAVGMLLAARPLVKRWFEARVTAGASAKELTTAAVVVLLASAYATEAIGLHALFGAFAAGAIMPERRELKRMLSRRFDELSSVALLPLFFALTGLRTSVGLLSGPADWGLFALVLACAVGGKFGGCALAARASGLKWRESLSLGALMNSRGLVELVVLNVGYDLGVLPPAVFAMLVLMALATTAATGPLLKVFLPAEYKKTDAGVSRLT